MKKIPDDSMASDPLSPDWPKPAPKARSADRDGNGRRQMSDTPRTDELHERLVRISEGPDWIAGKDYIDMAEHARQLERELADYHRTFIMERQAFNLHLVQLTKELAEARKDAERYRWMRAQDRIELDEFLYAVTGKWPVAECREQEMDSLIDAEMQSAAEKNLRSNAKSS